jgi:hypothetical protein
MCALNRIFSEVRAVAVILVAMMFVQGCATAPPRANPLPEELAYTAEIPGIPLARSYADEGPEYVRKWIESMSDEEIRVRYAGIVDREHNFLAISGGGQNGAFGAGLLYGWSESGTRPEFTMVTGISTGGLIAPFAFLGPEYDETLKEIYTSYTTSDLLAERSLLNIIRNDAAADSAPLRARIAEHVDEAMMKAIAVEHGKGRALFIGTTNLDAARPVMWNIGRIASANTAEALELIRDVMLASASIPGAFPPVSFDVEANGQQYEELHVDGGMTSQVFLYPLGIDFRRIEERLNAQGTPNLFVIRNASLYPDWETTDRKLAPIVGRTISSLIRTQGYGDLQRMYIGSIRDGLHFNLASIPEDFELQPQEPFDREYMNALFERGRAMSVRGYPWVEDPYHLEVESRK